MKLMIVLSHSESVSKLFTPHPAKQFEAGDHYYLFVDFSSYEEAQAAMNAMNGREGPWGANLRVQKARGGTWKSWKPSDENSKWLTARTAEVSATDETSVEM